MGVGKALAVVLVVMFNGIMILHNAQEGTDSEVVPWLVLGCSFNFPQLPYATPPDVVHNESFPTCTMQAYGCDLGYKGRPVAFCNTSLMLEVSGSCAWCTT